MKEITVLVVDHGLGIPIAERLARDCKRVMYWSPWEEGFSTINKAIIGDGIPEIERVDSIWDVKNEVDLFVFPDIQHSGVQVELESQGFPVWGSRKADRLETNRQHFMQVISELGFDVPTFEVCEGVSKLREYLKEKENCYIKISKYRGSLETKQWRNWRLDENLIDLWAIRFGAVRELIPFLVFDSIETELEIGADTYCIDGNWPSLMLHGIECKDKAYFSTVTNLSNMPEQVVVLMEAFGPLLGGYRYRNEFSMEVRVKGDNFYFIDPTTRLGLPSTGSQLELWQNWSEIVWAGANGVLVEPVPLGKFSAELLLNAPSKDNLWPTVEIPEELKQWVKLVDCCGVDGLRSWPREGGDDPLAGWLVAIGDSPKETLDAMKEHVSKLPDGLTADIAPLADVIKEIETEEAEGIEFSDQPMPKPESVIA